MEVNITIKHVNGMSKPKVTIEEGRIDYVLPFEVQLPPGDFERIIQLFRQRVPIMLTISSPQAKMDLFVETLYAAGREPVSPEEADELRQRAKEALLTSSRAEHLLSGSGDDGDRRTADDAQRLAAEAVSAAATALDIPENVLLTTLGEEVRQEMLDEGERQADNLTADEMAMMATTAPSEVDDPTTSPEELRDQIDAHVTEEEFQQAIKDEEAGKGKKAVKKATA